MGFQTDGIEHSGKDDNGLDPDTDSYIERLLMRVQRSHTADMEDSD